MIKAVIFDMDGVLVDNTPIHIESFAIFCERYGIKVDMTTLKTLFGKGNDEIIPLLLPASLIEQIGIEALANEKEQLYREIFETRITPAAGLIDFLEDLKRNNIKCAVGSSGPKENVEFVLDRCGIKDYFAAIANGDMVTKCKPDPEVFLLAAKLIDTSPEECVVIEDSFAGIQAAHSAKMKVIALATTYSREELTSDASFEILLDNFTTLTAKKIINI